MSSPSETKGESSAPLFSRNESAAQAFGQIAEYLQLKGENPFKVKAYVKAAKVLRDLEEDLESLRSRGELRTIPGVGKAIGDKLEAFLDTGTIPQLEALRAEIPAGLVAVSSLPGLGAKKTLLLFEALGVSGLEELARACREGRVAPVKGFSKKSEEKLLALAEKALASDLTFVKSRLEEWGARTVARLEGVTGLVGATVVGDVRRRAPQSDRLEILLCCTDPGAARQDVRHRISGGGSGMGEAEGAFVLAHPSGCPVHLHFCTPPENGWQTLLLTGPDRFARAFSKVAGSLSAPDERELFRRNGLPYVPPELRERPDPWGCRERLLEVDDIQGNLHAHSSWSDGAHSLEEMVLKAMESGHRYFGISDHSRSLTIANGLSVERLVEQGAEVRALRDRLEGIALFHAVECDILEGGELDYPSDVLARLDYVVAAVHSAFQLDKASQTERLVRAVSHPEVRILAHPTGRKLTRREGYQADWDAVFRRCAERGVAVEINSSPWRLDVSEELLDLALARGCLISVNTDAHSRAEFGYLRHGVDMARRVGLDPERVVNTWPVERLVSWFENGADPNS